MNEGINTPALPEPGESAAQQKILASLVGLISQPEANLGEIARVINQAPALRADLLRIANNENRAEDGNRITTVEAALQRYGIACVVVLVIRQPIAEALIKTFHTMFALRLDSRNPRETPPLQGEHLLGTMSFSGNTSVRIFLRMSRDSGIRILGVPPAQLMDATKQMVNIMSGNFKANLRATGLEFQLGSPQVASVNQFALPIQRPGDTSTEHLAFSDGDIQLFLDLTAHSGGAD
jgi:CheY-specific phosphatase CheX